MYVELNCRSNFSFLRGASHPEELVSTAKSLGLSALALTDDDGLYGSVKAWLCAKSLGLRCLVGSHLTLTDGPPVIAYVQNVQGYTQLCRLLSKSRLSHPKGEAGLGWRDLAEQGQGLVLLLPFPPPGVSEAAVSGSTVASLAEAFPGRFYVGLCRTLSSGDEARLQQALGVARALDVPSCAHNDVHTHVRARQRLQDVLTAIRHGVPVAQLGQRLFPNAERTLKGPGEMARLFADHPEALGRTLEISDSCQFDFGELRYRFPEEDLPPGHTAQSWLAELTRRGLCVRYPDGVPEAVERQVAHELRLIEALGYAGYFLTLEDIVRFAKEQGILCQGRGSAANSVICYALGITAIDPVRMGLLFERFLSLERKEPPDIDVDFEHERREEVLQYVYRKHGGRRTADWEDGSAPRAGMVCEIICYRGKLALKEVGKALGLSLDQVDRLSRGAESQTRGGFTAELLRELGISPHDEQVQRTLGLARELEGFPRHLSIHVGGFAITQGPLWDVAPLENAAMPGRIVVQWDKDDLLALGILKVDLLSLGMLTALSRCLALVRAHHGVALTLATLPAEDPRVYDMLCEADAVGVFQVESRAQMNLLPRLKPRTFYDLVVEVALIRPGPIIGEMVHPYLRRREGSERVTYPSEEVRTILEKTLGVPLFQEQAMRLAMTAAGFSPGDADHLRRILSHKRAEELLLPFRDRFIQGCLERGYPKSFAESCFAQFRGFAHYGFPESHAASFALLAYASAYLKCYFPAAFTAALLNAQPMGFYAPHTLVEDVKRHDVQVLGVDVGHSGWDCTLEPARNSHRGVALRLGLRMVRGLPESLGQRIEAARPPGGYRDVGDLARRARVPRHELARLALAGALGSLCRGRREALWEIQALGPMEEDDLFFGLRMDGPAPEEVVLPQPSVAEQVCVDYDTVGLSLDKHPLELLRPKLDECRALSASALQRGRAGRSVRVGGMVICRQRPPTAKGFAFLSLEDETGISNLVLSPDVFERYRREAIGAVFLLGEGVLERAGKVINVKVKRLEALELTKDAPRTERVPLDAC